MSVLWQCIRSRGVRARRCFRICWLDTKLPLPIIGQIRSTELFWTDLLDGKTEACTALDNLYQHCVLPVKVNAAAAYMDCWVIRDFRLIVVFLGDRI